MAGNSFGTLFRFTSWGESHGPAIGCVVDGVPPRIPLQESDIQTWLDKRRPGHAGKEAFQHKDRKCQDEEAAANSQQHSQWRRGCDSPGGEDAAPPRLRMRQAINSAALCSPLAATTPPRQTSAASSPA